jgi:hypothetical protein
MQLDPFFGLMAERRKLVRLDSVPLGSEVMLFDGMRGRVGRYRYDPPGVTACVVECVVADRRYVRAFSESAEVAGRGLRGAVRSAARYWGTGLDGSQRHPAWVRRDVHGEGRRRLVHPPRAVTLPPATSPSLTPAKGGHGRSR